MNPSVPEVVPRITASDVCSRIRFVTAQLSECCVRKEIAAAKFHVASNFGSCIEVLDKESKLEVSVRFSEAGDGLS